MFALLSTCLVVAFCIRVRVFACLLMYVLIGFNVVETPRNIAFCSYTILPESSEVLVVEDATQDPRFSHNPAVLGPPFIRFYAGAALIIDGVRIGSLCISDFQPRTFDINQRMNLLDIGYAVSSCIQERRRMHMDHNMERSHMMLSMMQGLRTPLFAMDMGVSVLQQEKEMFAAFVKSQQQAQQAQQAQQQQSTNHAKLFVSTVDDLCSSVNKLKMAVESTVILGKAFAASYPTNTHAMKDDIHKQHQQQQQHLKPTNGKANGQSNGQHYTPPVIMASAVALDIDTFLSQMKMVASIIGGKRVNWGECVSFLELLSANKHDQTPIQTPLHTPTQTGVDTNTPQHTQQQQQSRSLSLDGSAFVNAGSVKSFPDGINFVILSVLNHIQAFDFTDSRIDIDVCVNPCSSNDCMCALTPNNNIQSYCYLCDSSPDTVTDTHGNLTLTIRSRCLRAKDFDTQSHACGTSSAQSTSELQLAELSLQNSIDQVLKNIGGRFFIRSLDTTLEPTTDGCGDDDNDDNIAEQKIRTVDCFMCELPYVVIPNTPDGQNVSAASTPALEASAPAVRYSLVYMWMMNNF
jgi:hypothetical protein